MAASTATIRVTRETRDLLAGQAHDRGMSLSALLAEIARQREAEASFIAERHATRLDADDPEAVAEQAVWEATLADGIE